MKDRLRRKLRAIDASNVGLQLLMTKNVFLQRLNEFILYVFAFNPASGEEAERPESVS